MKILAFVMLIVLVLFVACAVSYKIGVRHEAKQWRNTVSRIIDEKRKLM